MKQPSDFWNALAPFHSALESNYFDLPSLHRILPELREPVLVVGAGQGRVNANATVARAPAGAVGRNKRLVR